MVRAIIFIDGNNFYHSCKSNVGSGLFALDYAKISKKLTTPREWIETRYYIGALKQEYDDYKKQRQFLSRIHNQDRRITIHYGRIEERPKRNELAYDILSYLPKVSMDSNVREELERLAQAHRMVSFLKEKAVDIMLAVDMYKLAVDGTYDVAYLLSADGDFTPAIEAVRDLKKKVFCASPAFSYALRNSSDAFITLNKEWFQDCFSYTK